jgi:colanic acid/amylovoran biosynthesis protein
VAWCILAGITGVRNRGVEALVVTTVEQFRLRRPDLEIRVLTRTPELDAAALRELDGATFHAAHARTRSEIWQHRAARALTPAFSPLHSHIAGAEFVALSGGDLFGPDYGSSAIQFGLWPARIALHADTPFVLLAQSIGPFHNMDDGETFLSVVRQAKQIAAREAITRGYLVEELRLATERVALVADPAFLLNPPPRDTCVAMLRELGIPEGARIVALAPAMSLTRIRGLRRADLVAKWRAVARVALDEWDAHVLLVPHVQELDEDGNDAVLAREIASSLGDPARVHVADGDRRAAEFKGLIGQCDLVVSQRMHAAIAGLSSGVPTVAVGFSIKYPGIMNGVIGRDSREEGLFLPVEEFMADDAAAMNAIRAAWTRRDEIGGWIREGLPATKLAAGRAFDLALEAVR